MAENSHIESSDLTIAEVLKDFYAVPDFQREYVWEDTHVEKLLQDIFDEFYDENKKISDAGEYFIGSIVTFKDDEGLFQLIDGQQRLTTSYLILCVIRDLIESFKSDAPDSLTQQISSVSMNPKTGDDISRYRLVLQYEDSQNVLETIAGKLTGIDEIELTTSSVTHIVNAYHTIQEFLQANFDGQIGELKKFTAAFTLRVKLIRIVTPNLSSALKLFETINDRGVGLNSMDLLKNLLFMKTSHEDYEKLKNLWKELIDTLDGKCHEKPLRFLRYVILANFELPQSKRELREDEIYKWFSDNQELTGIRDEPLGFVKNLIEMANDYAKFTVGKDMNGDENRYIQNVALMSNQARQHFILLLAGRSLNNELFSQLTRRIEELFFCYIITREPTKNFERLFAKWSVELRKVKNRKSLDEFIEKYFIPDLGNRSTAFGFNFQQLSSYRIQQYRLRYILAKVSQFIDENALSKEIPLTNYYKAVEIEHILPRWPAADLRASFDKPDEYDDYKVRLGNLTLLEKSINASLSNNRFTDKKKGYGESHIFLTQSIVKQPESGKDTKIIKATKCLNQYPVWDSKAIEDRQKMILKLAYKVWEIPVVETVGEENV